MSESTTVPRSTRRDLLKLTGAAALGAAGTAALGAVPARASGSGATLDMFFNPQHLTHGSLAPGAEVVIGPFPYPGSPTFTSANYLGIAGNLTAYGWSGHGWLSVRPNGMPFDAPHQAINLHFGGPGPAWANFFICQFGPPTLVGMPSDGSFIIRNGPSATSYLVDLHGFLGPDQ